MCRCLRRYTLLLAVLALTPESAAGQQPGWPCGGKVDPAYLRTSEATGGSVLLLQPSEMAGMSAEQTASRQHGQTVFRAGDTLEDGDYEFSVPVDSTITSVYFLVSMQCLRSATLVTPSGTALAIDAPDVEYHHFQSVRLFVVRNPAPGPWKVLTSGRGVMTVIVKAETGLRLGNVRYMDGAVTVLAETKLGRRLQLDAGMIGEAQEVGFGFVGRNAQLIANLDLGLNMDAGPNRSYRGMVTTPATDFRLAMTGRDVNGFPFQRVESQLSIDPGR